MLIFMLSLLSGCSISKSTSNCSNSQRRSLLSSCCAKHLRRCVSIRRRSSSYLRERPTCPHHVCATTDRPPARLMMCSSADDLRERAAWDGAAGLSRRRLLQQLQSMFSHIHLCHHRPCKLTWCVIVYIPPDVMLPPRRLPILLEQAQAHQRTQCLYHTQGNAISLLEDHACSRADFPVLTTQILAEHEHEVWYVQWSHDGRSLASASKDCSAIIWSIGPATGPAERDCRVHKVLKDHNDGVTALAWSMDDSVLLTSAGSSIKMWNARTGLCIRELTRHLRDSEISSLTYLHDGSGFVSAGMDRKIIVYDNDGGVRDEWPLAPVRISDHAISPDGAYLVAVGMLEMAGPNASLQLGNGHAHAHSAVNAPGGRPGASSLRPQRKVVIYDFKSRTAREYARISMHVLTKTDGRLRSIIEVDGELTSVKVSKDSRYAIANHAPNVSFAGCCFAFVCAVQVSACSGTNSLLA